MLDRQIEQFVRTRSVDVRHTGRPFVHHLIGVHDILVARGLRPEVCLAGLFHSIYGTNAFTHQTVAIEDRNVVAEMIGAPAERLAYIFCSCDRPRALVAAVKGGTPYFVHDRRDDSSIELSRQDLIDLLDIEIANLQEQGGSRSLLDVVTARYGMGGAAHA